MALELGFGQEGGVGTVLVTCGLVSGGKVELVVLIKLGVVPVVDSVVVLVPSTAETRTVGVIVTGLVPTQVENPMWFIKLVSAAV